MDRFSELPDYIIHQIMSYLPKKESAQTSILSKRWEGLFASYPILDFPDSYTYLSNEKYSRKHRINKFIEFVDASLLRFCQQKLCMQKFRLSIDVLDDHEGSFAFLDKWIRLAIEKKVEELDFDVQAYRMYTLPQEIFLAKSVTTLKLGGCKLENPFIIHSLKSLTLKDARINEEVLQKITSQCTSLEDLFLSDCCGFTNICLYNACKLKIINMQKFSWKLRSIKIVVPSLQQFIFDSESYRELNIVIDMAGCPNLKLLKLSNVGFTEQKFHELISKFSLLEDLNVCRCDPLEQIKISSHLLKKFSIGYCYGLKAIDIDTPNLLSFTYDTCPIPNSFSFDEFRKCSPSPPKEVGNLHLQTDFTSNYEAFLDGVLSICYPRILSVNNSCQADCFFIEWLYEKLINKDDNCCNIHDIKCWRHYLKNVKIESFIPYKDKKPLHLDSLIDRLRELPTGTFYFHLDW
ncbi:hypothetical protein EZV62_003964 [Acer yangbiense]|uniref:F-box domain-containing protein n=1 Tax=Acer yangbiense TaxID=1000413 RepID=A0A5C7IIY3_9ROSI|nr:hypothetical protein EZV62_003964 [Acer yangbiense]